MGSVPNDAQGRSGRAGDIGMSCNAAISSGFDRRIWPEIFTLAGTTVLELGTLAGGQLLEGHWRQRSFDATSLAA